jgi:hypothetical protein
MRPRLRRSRLSTQHEKHTETPRAHIHAASTHLRPSESWLCPFRRSCFKCGQDCADRARLSTQHEKHTNKGTLLTAHRGPVRLHPCQWPCAAAPVSEGGTIDSLDAWGVSKCRLCRVSVSPHSRPPPSSDNSRKAQSEPKKARLQNPFESNAAGTGLSQSQHP